MAIGNLTITTDTATCGRLASTFYRQGVGADAVCVVTNRTRGSVTYNQDTCGGDSGGPLIAFDGTGTEFGAQVGIVSWGGSSCPIPLGVYTRVIDHTRWILDNIATARGTPVPPSAARRTAPRPRALALALLLLAATLF
jgi:secreted trypsin-like serine protease